MADRPGPEGTQSPERPDAASSSATEGPTPRDRSRLRRILRLPLVYPRVTIEGILVLVATVVGLVILPSLGSVTIGPTAVKGIVLDRPGNIPSYALFIPGSPNTVVVGMDVPRRVTAHWRLFVVYNAQDTMKNPGGSNNVTFGPTLSSSDLGLPGYRGQVVTGTIAGGSTSYTTFSHGYFPLLAQQANVFNNSTGLPTDDATFTFTLTGPVQVSTVQGANVVVSLPTILAKNESLASGQAPAPVTTEIFYDAGTYQNLTGGPAIQGGTNWDWLEHGFFPPTVATGVDNAEQQTEQNETFIAAVFFGLAAAAGAAFAVELVEAVQHHRRLRFQAVDEPD